MSEHDSAIEQQATAWRAVFDELQNGNPSFLNEPYSGLECALIEIRRLQALAMRPTQEDILKARELLDSVEPPAGWPL